jgi:hypothetical protein
LLGYIPPLNLPIVVFTLDTMTYLAVAFRGDVKRM